MNSSVLHISKTSLAPIPRPRSDEWFGIQRTRTNSLDSGCMRQLTLHPTWLYRPHWLLFNRRIILGSLSIDRIFDPTIVSLMHRNRTHWEQVNFAPITAESLVPYCLITLKIVPGNIFTYRDSIKFRINFRVCLWVLILNFEFDASIQWTKIIC